MIKRCLIDNEIAKSLYKPRTKSILKNPVTRNFFMKETKNWENLIILLKNGMY